MLRNIQQGELDILNFLLKESLSVHCIDWEDKASSPGI